MRDRGDQARRRRDIGDDEHASRDEADDAPRCTRPMPPPRGVGCVCERRWPGRSIRLPARVAASRSAVSSRRQRADDDEPQCDRSEAASRLEARPIARLFADDAVDRPHRTPALAARALPVVRLRAEAAFVAAVHGLAFDELAREVAAG